MSASSFFIFLQETADCFCFIILNGIFVLNYNLNFVVEYNGFEL